MLPTASRGRPPSTMRANSIFPHYLRRVIKWQQMDIEYTFWQMLHLCTSPKVVYQHTKYHKQTKNQWARDDPAFIVILSLLLIVATSAYCAAYDKTITHAIFTVISVVLFHFIIIGAILATCCWFLTNTYLREETPNSHAVEQRVECYMVSILVTNMHCSAHIRGTDLCGFWWELCKCVYKPIACCLKTRCNIVKAMKVKNML
ncbi:protein unc-50 homolog isoform X3 [Amborella trichopoda]|uniref:protein unc-50 homolog isoform X3 n=1 Tax=Amborella trichopoda TaxID=13333 RepID=UPI0009BF28EA|nr:protein unc-50 homolog isoform X3 [Amborella trichopoda]|eukprot:XP_020522726.1 protein unc-50 homolog isoform X3 [Amborella trichopoda]